MLIIRMLSIVSFLTLFQIIFTVQLRTQSKRIVAIVATNDFHGHALPFKYTRIDNQESYTQGGFSILASLIRIVKQQFPGNTLFFDSGDQFQGGLQSSPSITSGALINEFMDYLKLDGAAIGNHDFDYGYQFLSSFLAARKTFNLLANVQNQEGKRIVFPKQKISKLYSLKNGIKIGAIGLTTITTPQRSSGWALDDQTLKNLHFKEYSQIIEDQSRKLREEGANAVVIVSHVGDDCFVKGFQYGLWTIKSRQNQCNRLGQIDQLLKILPKGTIDAVLQGHYHNLAHHYIHNIPVTGNIMGAKYFNILYLQFEGSKLTNTLIEGPIPVCQKVFKNNLQCQYINELSQLQKAGELVNWKFHDKKVLPDPFVTSLFRRQLEDKLKPYLEVVCYTQKFMKSSYDEETEIGNLLASAVQSTAPQADLSLISPSLLRQPFYPGFIRKIDLYHFHPFNSPFVLVKMTGKTFINALKYLQTLPDSYNFSNQLNQIVWMSKNREKRGLQSVKWYNGSQIDPEREIKCIVHNFTLSFVIQKHNITKLKSFGIVRDIFEEYLRKLGRINANDKFMNKTQPHLTVKVKSQIPSQ